jgi:prepilin-type N-terminal cleavage/methylation domain-containing protein
MFTSINRALDASRLKREENEKGFTLIELLVVVIIIGILAAIAIPVFLSQRESAWKASVESDLKNAALVIERFIRRRYRGRRYRQRDCRRHGKHPEVQDQQRQLD